MAVLWPGLRCCKSSKDIGFFTADPPGKRPLRMLRLLFFFLFFFLKILRSVFFLFFLRPPFSSLLDVVASAGVVVVVLSPGFLNLSLDLLLLLLVTRTMQVAFKCDLINSLLQ